jgi:hypothetical protein
MGCSPQYLIRHLETLCRPDQAHDVQNACHPPGHSSWPSLPCVPFKSVPEANSSPDFFLCS